MIRKTTLCSVAAIALAVIPLIARGDVRREQTLRRPYITEIGEPYSITQSTLDTEAERISELREYLRDYGDPDYAEIQEINPEWPWESYEVRVYYLRRNLEIDFGRVVAAEAAPTLGLMKFYGGIPAQKRHQIEAALEAPQPVPAPVAAAQAATGPAPLEALVARIEAAAERAAQAADVAAEHSQAAERAAERTANIVEKMEPRSHKR